MNQGFSELCLVVGSLMGAYFFVDVYMELTFQLNTIRIFKCDFTIYIVVVHIQAAYNLPHKSPGVYLDDVFGFFGINGNGRNFGKPWYKSKFCGSIGTDAA